MADGKSDEEHHDVPMMSSFGPITGVRTETWNVEARKLDLFRLRAFPEERVNLCLICTPDAVPAGHLAELEPPALRGTVPDVAEKLRSLFLSIPRVIMNGDVIVKEEGKQIVFHLLARTLLGFIDDVSVGVHDVSEQFRGIESEDDDTKAYSAPILLSRSRSGTNDFGKNSRRMNEWLVLMFKEFGADAVPFPSRKK